MEIRHLGLTAVAVLALAAQTLAIVGYAVGGLGVAAGVTLLLLDRSSSESASKPRVVPWVGYQSAGVSGTF